MILIVNKRRFTASLLFCILFCSLFFISCKDDYYYNEKEPDFLGANIYDYLDKRGDFKYFIRLINDLNYKDVLQKTGSKTLLPAKDEAFERFFETNPEGVRSYEMLSPAQKRCIMNTSMINMAYLSSMLSSLILPGSDIPAEGRALRRSTTNTYIDSIEYTTDGRLFENSYWNRFSGKGMYLLDDETARNIVHFTPLFMLAQGMTEEDFSILHKGNAYNQKNEDIYINGIKVIEKDIICKNGYVHIVDEVLFPSKNMAQVIRDNGETALFNKLLNRFCAPYFDDALNKGVHEFYNASTPDRPLISPSDSIFVKRYFTDACSRDPEGNLLTAYGLLYFDPASNGYAGMQDMGAMFVPNDQAMNEYLNGSRGRYLKEAYGSWENIPTPILALFLKNHQKKSFLASLPHTWTSLTDETSYKMDIAVNNVVNAHIAGNGVIYVTNKVFPPVDYQCVYGPTLTSVSTKIMNWAIQSKTLRFYLYLRSMENMYNLIVPTDEALKNYRDPIAWAKGESYREIWEFNYDASRDRVTADIYTVNAGGEKAGFLRTETDQSLILNRLNDIVDMHIVVGVKNGDQMKGYINDGQTNYALTKGGTMLKIEGDALDLKLKGGGDIEINSSPAEVVVNEITHQKSIYDSDNGRTYFINQVLHDPSKSVYTILGEHSEYTAFFDLLKGNPQVFSFFSSDKDIVPVFDLKSTASSSGLGFVVNPFNNFRYTVFVPTAEALEKAFQEDSKLFTWDEIADEENPELKKEKTLYLLNFLKYHLMDNLVFVSGKPVSNMRYETAARNASGKFYRLLLNSDGTNMEIQSQGMKNGEYVKANVITSDGQLYNLMARDFIVNNQDYVRSTSIVASSRVVIHLIDNVLKYE